MNQEQIRLIEAESGKRRWKRWGPYLADRQWGPVREDYSDDGLAWQYLTHDMARSKAYRWGKDGIGGICDDRQFLCLSWAFWNGHDPILRERLLAGARRKPISFTMAFNPRSKMMRLEDPPSVHKKNFRPIQINRIIRSSMSIFTETMEEAWVLHIRRGGRPLWQSLSSRGLMKTDILFRHDEIRNLHSSARNFLHTVDHLQVFLSRYLPVIYMRDHVIPRQLDCRIIQRFIKMGETGQGVA